MILKQFIIIDIVESIVSENETMMYNMIYVSKYDGDVIVYGSMTRNKYEM